MCCKLWSAAYNRDMVKKITLKEVGEMLTHVGEHMATKEDLEKLATKEQLNAVQVQVNSIESQLRGTRTGIRLGDLEEKVFGKVRS